MESSSKISAVDCASLYMLIFIEEYLFWSLIIQRVQNAGTGISHHSIDNQAPEKEH
jgi:hypothetical protein